MDEDFWKPTALFPNAVTEVIDLEVVRAIDKDVLLQETSMGKFKMIYIAPYNAATALYIIATTSQL